MMHGRKSIKLNVVTNIWFNWVISFNLCFLLELVLYTGLPCHKFVPKLHALLWHCCWVSDQSISRLSKMKTTSEWWKSGNERHRCTSCRQAELEAASKVMLSVGMRGSGMCHTVSGNERQRHTSCCQWEWEAAPYIMPSGRTRNGSIRHIIGGNERQHRTLCHQCMELVLLIIRYFVHRTLRRGSAPSVNKILYTFLLYIFFSFLIICIVVKY